MFKTGYILSRRADLIWFLGLPFVAVELAVVLLELLGYRALSRVTWRRALLLAAACNVPTIALSFLG